jgi:hypothetical protein
MISIHLHDVYTEELNKVALSVDDEKRASSTGVLKPPSASGKARCCWGNSKTTSQKPLRIALDINSDEASL